MKVKVRFQDLDALASHLGPAWKAKVLAASSVDGSVLSIEQKDYTTYWAAHRPGRKTFLHQGNEENEGGGSRKEVHSEKCIVKNAPRRLKVLLPLARLMRRLGFARPGDTIERLAKPVARAVGLKCHDPATGRLRPGTPCARARDSMNGAGRGAWGASEGEVGI